MRPTKAMNEPVQDALQVQVSNDLTVTILPHSEYEYLMDTASCAKGYGVSDSSLRSTFFRHKEELLEGKHWVKGVALCNDLKEKGVRNPNTFIQEGGQPNATYWTKAGIIRLGFFIKSGRAKEFRDWAEKVLLEKLVAPAPVQLSPAPKRKLNWFSADEMVSILSDICEIEDHALRMRLMAKVTAKTEKGGSHV